MTQEQSFFEAVGGAATFDRLVEVFYTQVEADDLLSPMYPEDDMSGARWRLSQFLQQYWGGPSTYSEQRGHPRLRMRHVPYKINPQARDRWLAHMRTALDEVKLSPLHDAMLWDYLERAAHSLINSFEE